MDPLEVPFGHLVAKFHSDEELLLALEMSDGQLRRYDGLRAEPLLPPPESAAPLGLSFVTLSHDRHFAAVAWAGCWLKREFAYDWSVFQPEVWREPGWREAFIHVADTGQGTRVVGAGACYWAEYSNLPPMRELAFVWFHPHFRRRGYLAESWPRIVKRWGPFIVQHPISDGMRGFLAKQKHGHVETTDGKSSLIEAYG